MVVVKDIQKQEMQVNSLTDHDIGQVELLRAALKDAGVMPNARLQIDIQGSTVTLKGVVNRFYLKQLAQAVTMRQDNVDHLNNNIQVVQNNDIQERSQS